MNFMKNILGLGKGRTNMHIFLRIWPYSNVLPKAFFPTKRHGNDEFAPSLSSNFAQRPIERVTAQKEPSYDF